MKFFARKIEDKKKAEEIEKELTALDKAILKGCEVELSITRVIRRGKPFTNKDGRREFATTKQILKSVDKLLKLEVLGRR